MKIAPMPRILSTIDPWRVPTAFWNTEAGVLEIARTHTNIDEVLTWTFRGEGWWHFEYVRLGSERVEEQLREAALAHAKTILDLRNRSRGAARVESPSQAEALLPTPAAKNMQPHGSDDNDDVTSIFIATQREQRPPHLCAESHARASALWSAELRAKVAEAKERGREAARHTPYWSPEEQSGRDL